MKQCNRLNMHKTKLTKIKDPKWSTCAHWIVHTNRAKKKIYIYIYTHTNRCLRSKQLQDLFFFFGYYSSLFGKWQTRDRLYLHPLNFFQPKNTSFKHELQVLYLLHFKSIFNVPYTDLKLIKYRFIIWNHILQIVVI